jgi:hypothetical protein
MLDAMPCGLRSRRLACVGFLVVLAMHPASSAPQLNAINGAPPGPRTAMVAGQVVEASGRPVPEAVVRLTMPKYVLELPTTPKGRVLTDSEGRYFFADLPAGDYYVSASKDGYVGGTYGLRRASGDSELLSLGEGERRTDAKLTLWKYAVLAGTVLDDATEPVVGVTVSALVKDVVAGRTRFGTVPSAPFLVPTTTTDDRGAFRLSMAPGTYIVAVPSTEITMPVSVLNASAQDASLRSGLFFAGIAEISPLGSPHTQQFGDFALMTPNRTLTPPPVSPTGHPATYQTTYFPSATTASAATQITLTDGQERTDLAINLRPVPAVRVSGHIVTTDGTMPPPMGIRMVGEASSDVGEEGFETAIGVTDARGRFTLLGVPAGEYVLKNSDRSVSWSIQQGEPALVASQRVTVGTADITDLTVTARPPLRVEGRVEIPGADPKQAPQPVLNTVIYVDTPYGDSGRFVTRVKSADLSFAAAGAPGRYVIQPTEYSGWFVKSVTLDGKDITDQAFDLQTDVTSLVVTFTDRASRVSGTVRGPHGALSADASVLAFPVDPARRSGQGSSPRNMRSTRTSRTGAYAFDNLPPGDYFVIAIDGASTEGWRDPATLEALAREATKLTVVAAEPKTLDLALKEVR